MSKQPEGKADINRSSVKAGLPTESRADRPTKSVKEESERKKE